MTDFPRNQDGTFAAYVWPGGYPLYYVDGESSVLCPACATKHEHDDTEAFRPIDFDIHWEGEPLSCDQCGKEIESAYGPVDE